jgi:hypothetical protein
VIFPQKDQPKVGFGRSSDRPNHAGLKKAPGENRAQCGTRDSEVRAKVPILPFLKEDMTHSSCFQTM